MERIILSLTLVLLLLPGCKLSKQERQDNKVAKKIENLKARYPRSFEKVGSLTVRVDTIIQKIEVEGNTEFVTDSAAIDSLAVLIASFVDQPAHVRDSLVFRTLIKKVPYLVNFEPISTDTLDIHLKIFRGVDGIAYTLVRDEHHIEMEKSAEVLTITQTTVVRPVWWRDPWFWILIIVLIVYLGTKILKVIYGFSPAGTLKSGIKSITSRF